MGFIIFFTFSELLIVPTSSAVVAAISSEEERGKYMGAYGLIRNIGWPFGPVFGGIMIEVFSGFHWIIIFFMGLSLMIIFHLMARKMKEDEIFNSIH